MPAPRYVVIANPGSKRWAEYERDLLGFWRGRVGVAPDVELVPWGEVIPRDGNLDGLAAFDRPAVVRLESPGRDSDVYRLLLQAGARDDPSEAGTDWLRAPLPKGLLLRPGLLYRGFRRVLEGLRRSFDARPHLKPTACPLAVAELFDKNATAARLAAAGIPVPPSLPEPESPLALYEAAEARGWPTTYVKLSTGSSATGIIVLHTNPLRPAWAVTSMARIGEDFYNTRRLRRIENELLDDSIAYLLREGVCVQRGIPMAQIDGQNFDVRVIVIYGKPAFTIFRLSPQPMTNLHLGGRRGDWAACRAAIPTRAWLDALDHCAEAAECYDSAMVGVDLLFERGYLRHYLLEVNAFGDFFPGWRDAEGRTVHEAEIAETARRL